LHLRDSIGAEVCSGLFRTVPQVSQPKKMQAVNVTERIELHRHRTGDREVLVMHGPSYSVRIEVTVRGIELDATTLERLLHAPMSLLANESL
jgi:hypothetical protein